MGMTEATKKWIRGQARFNGIFDGKERGFGRKIPLSSVPVYDECREYIKEALEAGLDGTQTQAFEDELAEYIGLKYAVAVSSGETALLLALKLAAEKLYGSSSGIYTPSGAGRGGALLGKKVFCPDLMTADMVNPIIFEGGEPIFIDSSDEGCGWSMSPEVLEMAFGKYPDVKIVVINHAYGFPGDILQVRKLCFAHDALLIECIGEGLGAEYRLPQDNAGQEVWSRAGVLGDYCVLNSGKETLLQAAGGAVLTRGYYESEKARYWAGGARAAVPWNQHEELGLDCLMSDLDAAVLRGRLAHLGEIIEKKRHIYETYRKKLDGSLAYIIPAGEDTRPNYWMTAMTCESSLPFAETRNDRAYTYKDLHGTAAPMEIYDALQAFCADCRPVYKPMSMQPVYRNCEHFPLDGPWRMYEDFSTDEFSVRCDIARTYYESGIVLPSDISMTQEEQDRIIDIVYACYDKPGMERGFVQ